MGVLAVSGLCKAFNDQLAVNNLDIVVDEGEVVGLLGPNGAGKTTTIRAILGIYAPDAGEISFGGSIRSMDDVGYLPEERGLYPDALVLDTLVYLASLKGVSPPAAKERALTWLERLELGHCARRRIETLSKGMQQKIQFIASIIHDPGLAILDEPFSGLDPLNQGLFLDVVRDLHKNGMTLLLSSHQMNLVESLCGRVAIINQGRVVLSGAVEDVKRAHGVRQVHVEYGGAAALRTLPGVTVVQEGNGNADLLLDKSVSPDQLLSELLGRVEIHALTVGWPPLHDVFVSTVTERGDRNS